MSESSKEDFFTLGSVVLAPFNIEKNDTETHDYEHPKEIEPNITNKYYGGPITTLLLTPRKNNLLLFGSTEYKMFKHEISCLLKIVMIAY